MRLRACICTCGRRGKLRSWAAGPPRGGWRTVTADWCSMCGVAQPMLPDPYAANWQIEHLDVNEQGSALAVRLIWVDHERPWMQAELTRPISVPTPPRDDEGDPDHDRDLARRRFRSVTGGARDYLALIDLSSHRFGVAVRPHQDPVSVSAVIDDYNRMTLPLHEVHLMMQPQTHWEPVHVVPNVTRRRISTTGSHRRHMAGRLSWPRTGTARSSWCLCYP